MSCECIVALVVSQNFIGFRKHNISSRKVYIHDCGHVHVIFGLQNYMASGSLPSTLLQRIICWGKSIVLFTLLLMDYNASEIELLFALIIVIGLWQISCYISCLTHQRLHITFMFWLKFRLLLRLFLYKVVKVRIIIVLEKTIHEKNMD